MDSFQILTASNSVISGAFLAVRQKKEGTLFSKVRKNGNKGRSVFSFMIGDYNLSPSPK
jgi:hypothetical protein